jgi:hypothetical protein
MKQGGFMMTKFAWSKVKTSDLYVSAIDLKPSHFDFGEGYAEKWDVLQPEGVEPGEGNWQEPMMNTWWPLPDHANPDSEAASKLAAEPISMCIVYNMESEEYGLALTGGGMDLSWDIAAAYVVLGYLPPVELHLPGFAGLGHGVAKRVTMAAMERAYRVMSAHMQSNLRDLRNLRKHLVER